MKKLLFLLGLLGFVQIGQAMEEMSVLKEELNKALFARIKQKGSIKEILTLLEQGADVDAQGESGRVPLHMAADCGHLEACTLLIDKGVAIDAKDDEGRTPLYFAARGGHLEVCKVLVANGANMDNENAYGSTPLMVASCCARTKTFELFFEQSPRVKAKKYSYLFHLAVRADSLKICTLLINEGADVNAKDNYGRTPPRVAIEKGHEKICELLLENGADMTLNTGLYLAASRGHENVCKLFIKKGSNVNCRNTFGKTPLLKAAENGHEEVCRLLLEKNAEVNARDCNGFTPLIRAAWFGHQEVCKVLIEYGADVHEKDVYKETPLYNTASLGYLEISKLLMEHGADLSAKDLKGYTPLDQASKNSHSKVCKAILERAAIIPKIAGKVGKSRDKLIAAFCLFNRIGKSNRFKVNKDVRSLILSREELHDDYLPILIHLIKKGKKLPVPYRKAVARKIAAHTLDGLKPVMANAFKVGGSKEPILNPDLAEANFKDAIYSNILSRLELIVQSEGHESQGFLSKTLVFVKNFLSWS